MTFSAKTTEPGREASSILELELDRCIRSYGTSPCTATLGLTNQLIRSQEFDNAVWLKTDSLVTANAILAPDGTLTADKFRADDMVASEKRLHYDISSLLIIGRNETFSVRAKAGEIRFVELSYAISGIFQAYAIFDLVAGLVIDYGNYASSFFTGADMRYIDDSTEEGYFRLDLTVNIKNLLGTEEFGFRLLDDSLAFNFAAAAATDGLYLWGAQMRPGNYAGKYAPTTTVPVDGMGTVDDLCFNTFGTCQDTPNYQKAADPAGTDIDYDIVNVDASVDTPDVTYVDVGSGFELNQVNLIDGDEYLILVKSFICHSISTSLNTNFVRLVDGLDVELDGSEYQFEAASVTTTSGYPYGYVNWITADAGSGDGLIKLQAQQTSGSGSVRTNSFRAFALNLTKLGTNNYARDRNTSTIAIPVSAGYTTLESIVLPSAGDWAIFGCVQNSGFNGGSRMRTRIHDGTDTLVQADHDIDDSVGTKTHARWATLVGAAGGETITLQQTNENGGVTWNSVYASLVAIRLDAFDEHFIFTGDPTDPASAAVYNGLTDSFDVELPGDYIWFGSLVEDWAGSGQSGGQRLTIDADGGGANVVSGDHTYFQDFTSQTEQNKFIYPNAVVALAEGEAIDVALNVDPAAASGSNVLTNASVWGFLGHIASPDPDPTLRFIDSNLTRPPGIIDAFPSIRSVRYGSTRINPGGKFSVRGTVSVQLQDFAHNDSLVDDYAEFRSWNAEDSGTFFGKLKERSKYYVGRPMRVLEGYIDKPFLNSNYRIREYIIENITGPTADGRVTVQGKDVLALARDDRAKAPTASTGTVRTLVTAGATSIDVSIGDGAQYDPTTVDPHIRINDEIILVNTRAGDVLTSVTRGQGGTTAAEHAVDDSIQACKTYDDEPVINVIQELLEDFANIDPKFIPVADWQTEEGASLTGYDMTTIITAPTGVTKLLQEISAITLIDLWYSDVDQEIKLKLQTPFTDVDTVWTDDDNILMDTVKVKDLNAQRLSRSLIYYGMRNFAEKLTEPENFNFVYFEIEADKEGVNKYDDEKIQTTFSRWFDGSNSVQVALTSQRLLQRFGITPVEISFDIDAKDVETLQTGDVYDVQTRVIQDVDGTPKTTRFQIVETKPKNVGSKYTYKSLAFFQDPTPDSLTITGNEVDYDIFVELGGPPAAVDVTVTVNGGVDVDATNGNVAMTTEGMHPDSTLTLINNGDIRGHGGNGGTGRSVNLFAEDEETCIEFNHKFGGTAGQAGGDALNITIDTTIDNTSGNIWAGAGGGGGGDALESFNVGYGGGGGGGGIGTDTGNGALGGIANAEPFNCFGVPVIANGGPGVAGTTGVAGSGGAKGGIGAGDGGDGGADWGDDGLVGGSGGFAGGTGGFAVRLNGNGITWEGGNNATQVKGDVA